MLRSTSLINHILLNFLSPAYDYVIRDVVCVRPLSRHVHAFRNTVPLWSSYAALFSRA